MRAIRSPGQRGQGLVEFAFVVPVFMLLLLGMLEFGIAFTHDQTLTYATREGARTGAALGKGNTAYPCDIKDANGTRVFDAPIIAAVERVLKSPGSPISIARIPTITVYAADVNGIPLGSSTTNTWSYAANSGPVVDGIKLDYTQGTIKWDPCNRDNGVNAQALGVSLTYTYPFQTSLGGIFKFMFGSSWSSLVMTDTTVMNLNPTAQ